MSMPGGWTSVEPVTPEVKKICLEVKSQIEAKAGTNFCVYTPLTFRSQTVAGTNYVVKVGVGGEVCVHAMIFAALPCDGGELTVTEIQYPKTCLVPF